MVLVERVLADGSRVLLPKLTDPLEVYLVAEDRVEGPVKVYAYITRGRFTLLNDALISRLHIVILDPLEGLWCFRDELGRRERRGLRGTRSYWSLQLHIKPLLPHINSVTIRKRPRNAIAEKRASPGGLRRAADVATPARPTTRKLRATTIPLRTLPP